MEKYWVDPETGEVCDIRERESINEVESGETVNEETFWYLDVEEKFKRWISPEAIALARCRVKKDEDEDHTGIQSKESEPQEAKVAFRSKWHQIDVETQEEQEQKTLSREETTIGGRTARKENRGSGVWICVQEDWSIPEYLREIAEQNLCHEFLPLSFLRTEKERFVYYDCSGYLSLEEYLAQWRGTPQDLAAECLRLLIELCHCLIRAENHLVRFGDLVLFPDTVFVSKAEGRVRIAFVPINQGTGRGSFPCASPGELLGKIVLFMEERREDSLWPVYAGGLRRELQEKNLSVGEALRLFQKMEREIAIGHQGREADVPSENIEGFTLQEEALSYEKGESGLGVSIRRLISQLFT